MKKIIAILFVAYSSQTYAFDDDPKSNFSTKANIKSSVVVEWITTNDVQNTCEIESKKRGNNGFGFAVQACSFWVGSTCTIITGKETNMHSLGHEVRHCFQGNWH